MWWRCSVWCSLLVTVVVTMGSITSAQLCQEGSLVGHCRCQEDQPGTIEVTCTCEPGQDLVISDVVALGLPASITSIHVSSCRGSVTVTPNAFSGLDALERATFQSITGLTLETGSLHSVLITQRNFTLIFDTVLGLSLGKNAVRFERQEVLPEVHQRILIQNSFIIDFQEKAISGNLSVFHLENVILSKAPASGAVDVGSSGASVLISRLNAVNQGLSSRWIEGHASHLSIVNSSFTLKPDAFAGVHMQAALPLRPRFTLRNNQIGFPKWYPGSSATTSVTSLPSGSLDLGIPDGGIFVDAANNLINCECQDLIWFYESPVTSFKSQVQASVSCVNGSVMSAIEECRSQPDSLTPSVASGISLDLAIVLSMVVWWIGKDFYCGLC